jgi:hypothetical protein
MQFNNIVSGAVLEKPTGDFCIASKMASKIGLIRGTGGVTPHIRTKRLLARDARLLLSLTIVCPSAKEV